MINNSNSLITSFFTTPHRNANCPQLSLVNTSPILLSPDSLESLETLSLHDNPSELKIPSQQQQLSELNDTRVMSGSSESDEANSIVLLEGSTDSGDLLSAADRPVRRKRQQRSNKQSTLSTLFNQTTASADCEITCGHTGKREKRKAAIRANQQMTNLLIPTRSRDANIPRAVEDRESVASIFLSTAEKKRLKEERLEEERRIQKREQEAEKEKYEAFLKFATENSSPQTVNQTNSQQTPSEDTQINLWTSLQHIRQLPEPRNTANSRELLCLIDLNLPEDYVVEAKRNDPNFLKLEPLAEYRVLLDSEKIESSISEKERDKRLSELISLHPTLPVRELYSHYVSLDAREEVSLASNQCYSEGKKRTRQRDMDNSLAFRSKRRRNQRSSPDASLSPPSSDCLIVDSTSSLSTELSGRDSVLWTEKYLPASTSLLLSDASAVSSMKTFLSNWQKMDRIESEDSTENCKNSLADSKAKSDLTDSSDDDFEFFLKRQRARAIEEDTRDSASSLDSLAGTMLLTGGVSTGKTSSVYVIAQELGMKVLEINSSMNRSGKDLQLCLSEATQSFRVDTGKLRNADDKTLPTNFSNIANLPSSHSNHFSKSNKKVQNNEISTKPPKERTAGKSALTLTDDTIILIDEVDLLFESERGFWTAFQQIASETKLPIFLTANVSNDYEIVPDIFTNHTYFQPVSVSKLSLIVHLFFLVHQITIPNQLATDMAKYFWPDLRQIIHLLQFWLTKRNYRTKKVEETIDLNALLASFMFRTELLVFNINSLLPAYRHSNHSPSSEVATGSARMSQRQILRQQYRARSAFSFLENYQFQLTFTASLYQSILNTATLGDGFSPDIIPGSDSYFNESLCHDILATECDSAMRLVHSESPIDCLTQSSLDNLERRDFEKKRNWEDNLVTICEIILPERSRLSTRDFGEHYLPYLKSICVSEIDRQLNNQRRYFKHYLSSSLTTDQIEFLTDASLAN